MKITKNDICKTLINELKDLIYKSQKKVLKLVNWGVISLYFEVGKDIFMNQKEDYLRSNANTISPAKMYPKQRKNP